MRRMSSRLFILKERHMVKTFDEAYERKGGV